jgi:Ca-activated chloride channel family protein
MNRMTLARTVTAAWLMGSTLLALAAPAAADTPTASLWSRLWRTPDQRGQALLQQGDAAGAAQAFADPQRKGHAALEAHDYAGAAKTLSGIDTAEAHYNRGNALAHTGDLQGAINAYDAALKLNPQHTDARHNRDVVTAALKKQQDQKQDKKENQEKQSKEDSKAGDKQDGKQDAKADAKPNDGKGDKADEKPGDKPDGKDGKPRESKDSKDGKPTSSPKDDAAQAQRDAETALGKDTQPGAANAVKQPPTEKQIAKEQWLRAIPEDPGGLLRRKFLIEHMLRQQGQKP